MGKIIAELVLTCSLFGIGFIICKKIPVLRELPETGIQKPEVRNFFLKLKNKINIRKYLPSRTFWQKTVLKIRILAQKVENKTFSWQQKLKEKSDRDQKNKDFWNNLKKLKK